jgi:hypothetical protein
MNFLDDDELSFQKGDLIQVNSSGEDAGWWYGSLVGCEKSGMLPGNYVQPFEPLPAELQSNIVLKLQEMSVSNDGSFVFGMSNHFIKKRGLR